MSIKPKISVITITYNQEKYIEDALLSFVEQNTSFAFEVIIADDCSSDGTTKIIKSYAAKYPDLIKPIYRKKNMGAWPNFVDALKTSRAEYIALCEGDDYWTDPNKLQIQADFLDKHADYALCFHPAKIIFENKERKDSITPDHNNISSFTVEELIRTNFIPTNSVLYRRQDYKNIASDIMPGDWYLHLYHAKAGKIGFINKTMSVYRRHAGGIWWDSHDNPKAFWEKYGVSHLSFFSKLEQLFDDNIRLSEIAHENPNLVINILIDQDAKNNSSLIKDAFEQYPELILRFLQSQKQSPKQLEESIHKLKNDVDELSQKIKHKDQELQSIYNSKGWKVLDRLYSTKAKLKKQATKVNKTG